MPTSLFINLPVKDLERSIAFYSALGWENNPNFTDANGASFKVADSIYVMLLTHPHFALFTPKPIADATSTTAVINSVGVQDPADIDDLVGLAVTAGAVENAPQDYGFMRTRTFEDPDGHVWEVMWMDPIAETGDWAAVQAKYPDMPPMPDPSAA